MTSENLKNRNEVITRVLLDKIQFDHGFGGSFFFFFKFGESFSQISDKNS